MEEKSRLTANPVSPSIVHKVVFGVSLALLVSVPLAFSTTVYRSFSLPKFVILLTGSLALVPLIVLIVVSQPRHSEGAHSSKHLLLVSAYIAVIALSTAFAAAPVASLVGSFENKMGLVTRICFYACFLAIIFGIGQSWTRLVQTLWAMALTGLCAATYAFAQFFGRDLFLTPSLYTFNWMDETIVRPIGTLGHADYLGNFLLYTTPLCLGLALGSSGRPRRLGFMAAAVSTAAIAFSGTRGAWLGLIVGGSLFVAIEFPRNAHRAPGERLRPLAVPIVIGCLIVLLSILLIASNPASRIMVLRARLFVTEGFTGAGRTLLWRDSLRMAPDFALAGCGPEGFRKTFPAYKSNELARFAPDINNESSHNSYLDALISFGLLGAGLYAATVASTFSLLIRARRRMMSRRRVVITGILSSFAAVTVHNLFIFDQIPTGLYFFGFLALAYAVSNMANPAEQAESGDRYPSDVETEKRARHTTSGTDKRVVVAAAMSGVMLAVGMAYSFLAVDADKHLSKAFVAANQGNLDQVLSHVSGATRRLYPTGDRAFVAARALTLCAERLQELKKSNPGLNDDNLTRARATAIEAAMKHAGNSLAHTLTPDSNYLLLAYLASLSGDVPRVHSFAVEALRWDPHFANSRWLMAEA